MPAAGRSVIHELVFDTCTDPAGAELDAINHEEMTALMSAAWNGHRGNVLELHRTLAPGSYRLVLGLAYPAPAELARCASYDLELQVGAQPSPSP